MGVGKAAAESLRAASPTAEGAPRAAERDESLVSARRAPPDELSLEAASEREDDSTDAAAFSLPIRLLPERIRTGIAVTVFSPKAPEPADPLPPLTTCDDALTVSGVEPCAEFDEVAIGARVLIPCPKGCATTAMINEVAVPAERIRLITSDRAGTEAILSECWATELLN